MIYELRIYRFHKGADNKKKFRAGFAKARRFMSKYGVTFCRRVGKSRPRRRVYLDSRLPQRQGPRQGD